ncbi:MAG: UvrD-helicase domain-containing protein [Gammaproteobacteria bacterium]|nr:UvrD-helicase domain-containing protein [Gammaproteobacteria bacterium]
MSLKAANPAINATVAASAGSGKTWLLVTRILRLLLQGTDPGGILALTFTRKAAGEMQQRLAERLRELATVENHKLDSMLSEIGLEADDELRQSARLLYESHQYCHYPVRSQTFHSFCQDILARFPLEADVPPGFDLLESSSLLIEQARDALMTEAALDMNGELAGQLQALLNACNGLSNLHKVLYGFLHQRSDWWAFTETANDPVSFATEILAQQLDIDSNSDPLADYFKPRTLDELAEFSRLLAMHDTKTNLEFADRLAMTLAVNQHNETTFAEIYSCFFTDKNTPRVRKDSKALRKKMGDDNADRLLALKDYLTSQLESTIDHINRHKTYELNQLWYRCGQVFVNHYQRLKRQQRLLDFTDLEWRTYQLLQHSENALWVQYKLDQRIEHLLVDEFQDTNPTQWQLILPLLEEMAASSETQKRSIFLVGDEKQSIYSFRRAKPELLAQAACWLQQQLAAQAFPMNKSWRSSPAIIQCVNQVFEQEIFKTTLPGFDRHDTHRSKLAGKVCLLPLNRQPEKEPVEPHVEFRNPLQQPRIDNISLYLNEGKQIASKIQQLINDQLEIDDGENAHTIDYNDIFILVRKRSHVAHYERALRDAGIPYLGANKGTFLDCLEIQDMEALLDTLLTPFNNLALAQVLKSPLFSASDDDLMLLAQHNVSPLWLQRINDLHSELAIDHPVHRACLCLNRWQSLADKIPVHDLLDRIYSEANVLNRYMQATPDALKPRVKANLNRFIELALDLDSGRYPSLMHFLQHLRSLKRLADDAPDEAPVETAESRVRIMTIHASKGLEAPVVFLADTLTSSKDTSALTPLVDWPVEQTRPQAFQLLPAKSQNNSISQQLLDKQNSSQNKEQANLLYVAVTRAKQMLFISATEPADKGQRHDWYGTIKQGLENLATEQPDGSLEYCFGDFNTSDVAQLVHHEKTLDIDPRLRVRPENLPASASIIAPSKTVQASSELSGDEDGLTRGIAIHRCLELMTAKHVYSHGSIKQILASELSLSHHDPIISQVMTEASNVIENDNLKAIFKPDASTLCYNELPLHYQQNNKTVYGIIDRLLVDDDKITLIDYKSHQQVTTDTLQQLADSYQPQLQLYADGLKQIWPDKTIQAALLFTHLACLHYVQIN